MAEKRQVSQPLITETELNKINKYHSERKKAGIYKPWVTVRQSHTQGRGQILSSHKADHEIHLLSEGELLAFLKLEHEANVVSIFEQWPLIKQTTKDVKMDYGESGQQITKPIIIKALNRLGDLLKQKKPTS